MLEKFLGRSATAASLAEELEAAEARLVELRDKHPAAALAAYESIPGRKALADLEARIAEERRQAETLRGAHAAALEREAARRAATSAKKVEQQCKTARGHSDAHEAAILEIARAISILAPAFRKAIAEGTATINSAPEGTRFVACMLTPSEIIQAIQIELWRCSADGSLNPAVLPGADSHDIGTRMNPGAIAPLTEKVAATHARVQAQLTGGPSIPQPAGAAIEV
jgi:hypothetical protein